MNEEKLKNVGQFAQRIRDAADNEVVEGILKTSERVLKRITDGIYRQPSSALRELISNAYDADATFVEIQTDPPRFDHIIVRDNGNGLTAEALSYLIHNIGGSAKRTFSGAGMGVCNETDRTRSPGGRKLIGKIGIGLFSVSQLTKEFQVITKTKGANHRTIADVVLHTDSEDALEPDQEFVTGSVSIWKVPATDTDSHGTEIILRNLLPKTIEDLTSKEMWDRCNPENKEGMEDVISVPMDQPAFHIGCVHKNPPNEISKKAHLPWDPSDSSEERFRNFVKSMDDLRGNTISNPSIYDHLDYYLRMLWILSLSSPIDYVEGHPFDIVNTKGIRFFRLGNNKGNQAEEIKLNNDEAIRDRLCLISPERGGAAEFSVIVDGVQLFRPITFKELPRTQESVPFTLFFVGKDSPDLSSIPKDLRGGDLEFEAYFLWNHIVVPKEHAGVLVRINDSNGVLFDSTFMDYPTSELTRKRQVTAEVFVTKGLDAALNIDRESFNYSHPHYVYIMHWVHNAFRQFATRHKAIAKTIKESSKKAMAHKALDHLEDMVDESLRAIITDEDIPLPIVEFTDTPEEELARRKDGVLAFRKDAVFERRPAPSRSTMDVINREAKFEIQIKAVAQILDAYGVFNDMPYDKQQKLLRDIVLIFSN